MPTYEVVQPFPKPDGGAARIGRTETLTARQAKYLLLSGKIKPAAAKPKKVMKKTTKKQEE